jgi:hypothetical protein
MNPTEAIQRKPEETPEWLQDRLRRLLQPEEEFVLAFLSDMTL